MMDIKEDWLQWLLYFLIKSQKGVPNIILLKITITNSIEINVSSKMKPIDLYAEFNVDSNEKDPKFQVGDQVRISKYENIFGKGYTPNWSKEVLEISKIKNTVPWIYAVNDLNGENVVRTFYEKL